VKSEKLSCEQIRRGMICAVAIPQDTKQQNSIIYSQETPLYLVMK
jgi:hypothetical protein